MWDTLGTWEQILKSIVIGLTFAVTVFVGNFLMHRVTSKTIAYLRQKLKEKNGGM